MEISSIDFFPRHTRITVKFRNRLYSSQVPGFAKSLLLMLPALEDHVCHNRKGLSFTREVEDTELGHVLEHVILALLGQRGIYTKGQTTWNWDRDPIGMYHITVQTGRKYVMKESILVAQAILTNALVGPVVKFSTPSSREGALPLLVQGRSGGEGRVLFSAGNTKAPVTGL